MPADGSCGPEWCRGKGDACARPAAVCAVGPRECCCLPAQRWQAQGPALHVREALSFLPSSCFLPDRNELPIFSPSLPPLQHKHVSPQRQPERLEKAGWTMGASLLETLAPVASRAEGFQGARDRTPSHYSCLLCSGRVLFSERICDNFRCSWLLTNFSLCLSLRY